MADVELKGKIELDDSGAKDSVDNLGKSVDGLKDSTDKLGDSTDKYRKKSGETEKQSKKTATALDKFFDSLKNVKDLAVGAVTGYLGVKLLNAIKQIGAEAISGAAKWENYTIALSTMLGSAKDAQNLLSDIERFAATTPFQLDGLVAGSKRLLAFGVSQEKIIPTMKALGDVAQGQGDILDRLTLAYGKVQAKGKASLEELNMFTEAGVPVLDKLAKSYGITTERLLEMVTKGKIGFKDVEEAIMSMTSAGGQFEGMTEKMSQSLDGLQSTLEDQRKASLRAFGEEISPLMKRYTLALMEMSDQGKRSEKRMRALGIAVRAIVKSVLSVIFVLKFFFSLWVSVYVAVYKAVFGGAKSIVKSILAWALSFEFVNKSIDLVQEKFNSLAKSFMEFFKDDDAMAAYNSQFADAANNVDSLSDKIKEAGSQLQDFAGTDLAGELKDLWDDSRFAVQDSAKIMMDNISQGVKQVENDAKKNAKVQLDLFQKMKQEQVEMYAERSALASVFLNKDIERQDFLAGYYRQKEQEAIDIHTQTLMSRLMLDTRYTQGVANLSGAATTLMGSHNKLLFNLGKATAITNAVINTAVGATKAYAQLGIFGAAGAALVTAAGAVQIAAISRQSPPAAPKTESKISVPFLANGGLISGSPAGTMAMIAENSRSEAVLPLNNPRAMRPIQNALGTGKAQDISMTTQVVVDGDIISNTTERRRADNARRSGSQSYYSRSVYK